MASSLMPLASALVEAFGCAIHTNSNNPFTTHKSQQNMFQMKRNKIHL